MPINANKKIGADVTNDMAVQNHKDSSRVPVDPSLLEWAEYWYPISWKGVLAGGVITAIGACATIAFLLLQWRTTAIREEQSDWRTSVVELDTARAKADLGIAQADITKANVQIAEANARQKEAELKLEQLRKDLGPRQLQRGIFINELQGRPTAPVEVMYLLDDPECFALAQEISGALKEAGWPSGSPKPIPPLFITDSPTSMSVDGQPSGVTVVVNGITQEEADAAQNAMAGRDWVKTPWTVLSHAIGAALGRVSGHAGGLNAPPAGTLRVVVAPRL
jgi:hypothetical protein